MFLWLICCRYKKNDVQTYVQTYADYAARLESRFVNPSLPAIRYRRLICCHRAICIFAYANCIVKTQNGQYPAGAQRLINILWRRLSPSVPKTHYASRITIDAVRQRPFRYSSVRTSVPSRRPSCPSARRANRPSALPPIHSA